MNKKMSDQVIAALERISEAFKVMLWDKAKLHGLSPIQIQILIFIANHNPRLSSVSHLAREFNLTKPTVSDAVRVLLEKGLLTKGMSASDNRSYTLVLSRSAKKIIRDLDNYTLPFRTALDRVDDAELSAVYGTITRLIYQLNRLGILSVQRTCFACRFYDQRNDAHYCQLLRQPLFERDIRLDCPEFEEKSN